VAFSVVKGLIANFKQAKKLRKAKQNRPFQTKRAGFVELLSEFEPETSSLPTDWKDEVFCFPDLLCPLLSGTPCSPALFRPLVPSARFPVWVTVWVSQKELLKYSASLKNAYIC